jgi:hypothetical protein
MESRSILTAIATPTAMTSPKLSPKLSTLADVLLKQGKSSIDSSRRITSARSVGGQMGSGAGGRCRPQLTKRLTG